MLARVTGSTLRVPMYALALLLTFGLVVGLAGCGGEQPATTTDEGQATSDQDDQDQTQDAPQDETADETTDEMDEADETADTSDDETSDGTDEGMTDETEQGQQDETSASGQEATDDESMTAIERGEQIYNQQCMSCHSTDGSRMVGPTWQGAYGHEVELQSGETITADEAYIRESIRNPSAKIVQGYPNSMPSYGESQISEDDLEALIAYMKSLSDASEGSE